MDRREGGVLLAVALLVGGVLVHHRAEAPGVASALRLRLPPPTVHVLGEEAEGENKSARKAWFRQIHRAPPGVDPVAVERDNGRAQLARRNGLVAAPPPPDGDGWTERGSDNQAGRMHAAAHSPDHGVLYGGSALGGVWRGTLDGTDWEPIGDNLYGGAHWLAAVPGADGDVVLAATDWGAVHVSADDGATWGVPEDLGSPWQVRRVRTRTDGSDEVLLVLRGDRGTWLVRGTPGLAAVEERFDLGSFAGDLWADRDGGHRLALLTGEGLQWSLDGGESWHLAGPLPDGPWTEGWLAASEAGAPRVWAVVADDSRRHLLRSDDAGATWETVSTALDDFWGTLEASIDDVDRFAYGGMELHRTTDGGRSWGVVNRWYDYYDDVENKLHADIMGIDVFTGAEGEELWYVSTDGGLFRSTDRLDTVQNLSLRGLRISQYYSTLTSAADPTHVAAGAQDQGLQRTQGQDLDGPIWDFEQVISGDYGHLTSGDGTHALVFSVYPGFVLVLAGEGTAHQYGQLDFPAGETQAWLPPVVADPEDPESFFFCATRLWRYQGEGGTWSAATWSEQSFQASEGEYLSAFALSPVSPDRAFAATSYGRMFWSTDRGVSWRESEGEGPAAHYFYGTALLPSKVDADLVYAGGPGYGGPPVYRSLDGGRTWAPFADGLPDTTVYALAEAPDGSGRLVAGTATAVYRRDPEDTAWRDVSDSGVPVTIFWSAEALPDRNAVRFGTYGRGIWDYAFEPSGDCVFGEDADGDGVPCQDDCDDGDPQTFPGAPDACDGIDRDCNPDVPDEVDLDGDGHPACDDCNDERPGTWPGAPEICGNGIDEDCDGLDSDLSDCEAGTPGEDGRRCGCGGAGPAAGWPGFFGLGLLVVRRRRYRSR